MPFRQMLAQPTCALLSFSLSRLIRKENIGFYVVPDALCLCLFKPRLMPRFCPFLQVRRWLHQVVTFVLRLACWHEPLSASPVAIHAARTAASSLTINVEEVSAASMSSSSSSAGVSGAVGTGAGGGAGTSGNKSGSAKGSASSTQAGSVLAKAAADALEIAANVAEQSNSSGGFGNNSASSGSGTSSSHNDPGANSTNSNSGAEMGVSGNDGSYLVALDAYVAARVGMIGRGIG